MHLNSSSQLIVHLCCLTLMVTTWNEYMKYVLPVESYHDFSGSSKFLTFLNIIVQLIYYFLATFIDIRKMCSSKGNKTVSKLDKLKDYFLASVAFPYTMIVCFTFWIIYLIDRELIYPSHLDELIPVYINHLMHTTVAITGVEFFISNHSYPSRKSGFSFSVFTGLSYFAWISYIRSVVGYWPYKFMDILDVPSFAVFIIVILILVYAFYVLGERLHVEPKKSRKKVQ